jgi:hypothetical protein
MLIKYAFSLKELPPEFVKLLLKSNIDAWELPRELKKI